MSYDLPSLRDRLISVSSQWADAQKASLARLGRLVVNDTGFHARLEQPGASTTTATLEKFAIFLADPANWPDEVVPEDAKTFAHVVGITLPKAMPSAGLDDASSSQRDVAA